MAWRQNLALLVLYVLLPLSTALFQQEQHTRKGITRLMALLNNLALSVLYVLLPLSIPLAAGAEQAKGDHAAHGAAFR